MESKTENNNISVDAKCERQYLLLLKEALASAREEWEKPWLRSMVSFSPQGFEGNLYNGANRFWLSFLDQINGYTTPIHVTFPRAISEGFSVNKGEHGMPIVKYNSYYLPDESGKRMGMKYASEADYAVMDDETKAHYYRVGKAVGFTVFNLDQTNIRETNPELYQKMLDRFTVLKGERDNTRRTAIRTLDETIANNTWICPIKTDSVAQAYWNRSGNYIRVPDKLSFKDDASFYRTLIHEMIHSTSLLPKCELTPFEKKQMEAEDCPEEKRKQLEQKKTEPLRLYNYKVLAERAREEMVADLGAAMVMTQIGIDATFSTENKAYLQAWYERIGLKEGTGPVLNPTIRKFVEELENSGWQGGVKPLLSDIAGLVDGNTVEKVMEANKLPDNREVTEFLKLVSEGKIPVMIEGHILVPMTDEERAKAGISENVLSEIVRDAWKAAKIVMQDGLKMNLEKDIKQGEDFSKINDKKREATQTKGTCRKKYSKSTASRNQSGNNQMRKKYGR